MSFPETIAEVSRPTVRIVIPAYNEAKNLPSLCERIASVLKPARIDYQLFIVDDGSKDDTRSVVASLQRQHPIRPLIHEVNRGLPGVFLTGIRAALENAEDNDTIVIMEGDGTSDPAIIPSMMEKLRASCDVAVASRYAAGGGYRNFPPKRLFLSRAANVLLRWLCPIPGVRDYTIFYRAYRAGPLRRAVETHGDSFTSTGGFACNAEMLLRLRDFISRVDEVPLMYDYGLKRGASGMRIGRNLKSYVRLFRIFYFERKKSAVAAGRTGLLLILAAAFAVRALYCWRHPQATPGGGVPNIDEFQSLAMTLREHGSLLDSAGQQTAFREPGYPLLLAAMYWATGPKYAAVAALHCLLGTLTVLFLFLLGREVFGSLVAHLAALMAALHPQLIFYTNLARRETWMVFLAVLGAWLVSRSCRRPSAAGFAGAGAAWALAALANSVLLPAGAAVAAAAWLMLRRRKERGGRWTLLFFAVLFGLYSLWPIRNYMVFHRFIPGITGGAPHLYLGLIVPNNVAGTSEEAAYLRNDPVLQQLQGMNESDRDRLLYAASFRWIRRHPLGFGRVMAGSFLKLWRLYPYQRDYGMNYRMVKWVSLLSDGWIIPLGFFGMVLARRRYPETDLFNLILVSVTLTYVVFWAVVRYRLPMMPFVMLYAAYALERFWRALRKENA